MKTTFATEKEMSQKFEKYLRTEFGSSYIKEFPGLFGIPDFVYYIKEDQEISIVSFELKLKDWRQAAKQAFRYKSFSHIAYVVMPNNCADNARKNIELFKKYKIGLAVFGMNNEFEIIYSPSRGMPYSDSLNKKLTKTVTLRKNKAKNYEILIRHGHHDLSDELYVI